MPWSMAMMVSWFGHGHLALFLRGFATRAFRDRLQGILPIPDVFSQVGEVNVQRGVGDLDFIAGEQRHRRHQQGAGDVEEHNTGDGVRVDKSGRDQCRQC